MVFQEGRLFPHLSVRQNLLYGAWFARVSAAARTCRASRRLLGIAQLLDAATRTRSPAARSSASPSAARCWSRRRLLLMDEPLASLDEPRKQEIMPYLEALRDEARIPIVYVSHSVAEVARLSDTLVILDAGKVRAAGPTAELMQRLDLLPAGGEGEPGAVIEAVVQSHDEAYGLTACSRAPAPGAAAYRCRARASRLRMQIKARDVMIALEPPGRHQRAEHDARNRGRDRADGRAGVEIRLDCGGEALIARITRYSVERLALRVGTPVFAIVKAVSFEPGSLSPGAAPGQGAVRET